jgi:uncharacterized linocin/CFP29 family protein
MTAQRKSKLTDPDMQAVPTALARAAKTARELAKRTATSLVVSHDRHVALVSPEADQGMGTRQP